MQRTEVLSALLFADGITHFYDKISYISAFVVFNCLTHKKFT